MLTDPRTGMRSIKAARETLAAVALISLTFATLLRAIFERPGGIAGAILALMAVAVVSRYRVSWDEQGIYYQTLFTCRRHLWSEVSAYSIDPQPHDSFGRQPRQTGLHLCRLHLYGSDSRMTISLQLYCWSDIRHLTDRIGAEVPVRDRVPVLA